MAAIGRDRGKQLVGQPRSNVLVAFALEHSTFVEGSVSIRNGQHGGEHARAELEFQRPGEAPLCRYCGP